MSYIPSALRRLVIKRAGNCCEYCRLSQDDDEFSFHIDHIVATKHGGQTEADNLCLSCFVCNTHKGSDITSIDHTTGTVVTLYHPRQQVWADHFRLDKAFIVPLTPHGRATAALLRFNATERLAEREILLQLRRYPCPNP
jgi:hypothetical protein